MSTNDAIILNEVLTQRRTQEAPALSESDYFEIFAINQTLKDYDLSYEELESGLVDGGGDGGLDAIYLFINGDLVHDDTDLHPYKRNVHLELFIIQAKTTGSFGESAMLKFQAATEDLLDLASPLKKLKSVYNAATLTAVTRFRETYKTLAGKFPTLSISYIYVSKGSEVHPNVRRKVDALKRKVEALYSAAEFQFEFLGASNLLELARRQPKTTHTLTIAENPIASKGTTAFVCLASLQDYFKFLIDEKGQLRRSIFESNVRDYQGATQVNDAIGRTLGSTEGLEDFWWLNNGVTILCSGATHSGKILTIEDPQIVNGLQTSTEVFKSLSQKEHPSDDRNILVRVIVPTDSDSRDQIIKATNSQTTIPIASLRSTDKVHRDIEEYFRAHGLFYDRRKNLHKNEGRPIEKIISIPYLAQAVMAITLQRPDTARARPSSLLKDDQEYRRVFDDQYPITLYSVCVMLMRSVDEYLRSSEKVDRRNQANLRYYVAMDISVSLVERGVPSPQQISQVRIDKLGDQILDSALERVKAFYDSLGSTDQISKGPDLLAKCKQNALGRFPSERLGTASH